MFGSYRKPAEIKSVVFPKLMEMMASQAGKTVAITGCTSGTGFIAAKALGEKGAKIIMLNRPSARADESLQKLKDAGIDAELIPCDLMSFAKVRAAADALLAKGEPIDCLINNAGIMASPDAATEDGYDTQMQTNHLSHFLLTGMVWPLLEKAPEGRVVNHSSESRKGGPLKKEYFEANGGNLGGDSTSFCMPFSGPKWSRYHQTKLANIGFTFALRDRTEKAGSKVKTMVAHPGLASTNLQVTTAGTGGMGQGFTNLLMKFAAQSGEDGTVGILTCATKPDAANGDFYGPKSFGGAAICLNSKKEDASVDAEARDMLWETSLKATGVEFPF